MSSPLLKKAEKMKEATREQMVSFITAALSLVAGLAWNDAIASAIKEVFPIGASSIVAKFLYAVLMTVVVVVMTLGVRRVLASPQQEEK